MLGWLVRDRSSKGWLLALEVVEVCIGAIARCHCVGALWGRRPIARLAISCAVHLPINREKNPSLGHSEWTPARIRSLGLLHAGQTQHCIQLS